MKKTLEFILKRDGRKVAFDPDKTTQAMYKAFIASGEVGGEKESKAEAQRLTPIAVDLFTKTINGNTPSVETMQDVVEMVLMAAGHYLTAKAYILYRAEHEEEREAKGVLGVKDDLGLSVNQLKVLERRYLRHDAEGKVIETPRQLFERVAKAIAANEGKNKKKWEESFFQIISKFEFVPAGCYFRGAGNNGMLANCFVLPIEDSIEGIFDAVKWMSLIHQKGGGTGFNFSKLRPKGDYVMSSGGFSTGPISFMKVFDAATRQVMQGGYKQGANMGILNVDHPDILDFITCKTEEHEINNFNISVGISDKFMEAVESGNDFDLINPRTGEVVQSIAAHSLFNQMVTLAWRTGDPGMIYLDAINRHNPVMDTLGPMLATNPCGEQPLHPFDVCNLGSINLAKFIKKNVEHGTWNTAKTGKETPNSSFKIPYSRMIDWQRLEEVVRLAVRFLDNGVDVSVYPIPQVTERAKANRRIGLGVMGFADMLYQLRIGYDTDEAFAMAEKVMKFIYSVSHNESEVLAEEKGVFPNWEGSTYQKQGVKQRNIALTTIAPTGTIAMVADCSSGIEPIFALSYVKNVVDEQGLTYVNPYFQKALEENIEDDEVRQSIIDEIARTGSCQQSKEVPQTIKEIFVTAHDLNWETHVKMQASFQKWTDNAVSKTINFPHDASITEVEKAYLQAWKLGCKGITIYRDGSKSVQILQTRVEMEKPSSTKVSESKKPIIQSKVNIKPLKQRIKDSHFAEASRDRQELRIQEDKKDTTIAVHQFDKAKAVASKDVCPECGGQLQMSEGCSMCLACGFSKCSL